eukprot:CAMPEP_0174265234 /NCGR_PEP_ID=MMETSP0439-20130205/25726_1 /TAXON_ID=0 /ORGANISM="Stereomyxa ramosa, Strain Chinc5" /LENGTH=119 /DNA_ID=CAMNT_0015351591 /DNA_START=51 /DNA_END=410 /DNA_ORIENTATION=+
MESVLHPTTVLAQQAGMELLVINQFVVQVVESMENVLHPITVLVILVGMEQTATKGYAQKGVVMGTALVQILVTVMMDGRVRLATNLIVGIVSMETAVLQMVTVFAILAIQGTLVQSKN